MKVYSAYRKTANQERNTLKTEIVINWQRVEDIKEVNKKRRSREEPPRDRWADLVARRIQVLGEKLSGFFYPEVVE
ncbi:MAG: hypothetical protein A2W93_16275 [Bacteroidetes bacterium GWF2_43_63]|nr:MAG: hypothetical protein A2W94_11270 [Bacteroidetes bacterium GWE2_42_42]OFY54279.1 MAG: hypothetical protein A2W93_16275 [Bacteroidetes bacterium GWF2_43_63]HBG69326.1 hypothetical protein [Bacteroidales bacterium]HCB60379.1 hypothetical protein [Bacteroidales bacterium]HCY23634.1 hypothetical protein [Bacteroidales bacterium]